MTNDIGGKPNPHFEEAMKSNFTINSANGTTSVKCAASSFENTDPLPGGKKQCMCDNAMTSTSDEALQVIKESWRQKTILNQLHNALVQATEMDSQTKTEADNA